MFRPPWTTFFFHRARSALSPSPAAALRSAFAQPSSAVASLAVPRRGSTVPGEFRARTIGPSRSAERVESRETGEPRAVSRGRRRLPRVLRAAPAGSPLGGPHASSCRPESLEIRATSGSPSRSDNLRRPRRRRREPLGFARAHTRHRFPSRSDSRSRIAARQADERIS